MKRIIIIVIAAAILALILLLIFYRPSKPANSEATNYPSAPSTQATAYEPQKVPPASTTGLTLNAEQKAKLTTILKSEDDKIRKIAGDPKLKDSEKAAQIQQVFGADRAQVEKLLPADQYRRLVLIQNEHAGEVLAAAQ
jgi:hypothetical protein